MSTPFRFAAVYFDCDSTLSTIEGIDELAALRGCADEVAAMTNAAMDGTTPLEQVYARRLDLIRPTAGDLEKIADMYKTTLVPGAREVIAGLQDGGVRVHVISGGIYQAVKPFAEWLGVPAGRVHAVHLSFDRAGHYRGFLNSPLATATGKIEVIRATRGPGRAMLVGDGSSDLAAAAAVDQFVGFGGVVAREGVMRAATVTMREPSLTPVLDLAKRL
jgi:phosphoserine phosphatase